MFDLTLQNLQLLCYDFYFSQSAKLNKKSTSHDNIDIVI